MKSKYKNFLIIIAICYLLINVIKNREIVFLTIDEGINIWINNLVPSLFPFFIISDILINYDVSYYLARFLDPIFYKLFKINSSASIILILSMISGFPSNGRNTRILYDNKSLNKKECEKILTFSHFSNPLFILGTLAIMFLNNKDIGFIILTSHYIGNFIIGIIFRNYYKSDITRYDKEVQKKYFSKILINSIINSINTLLLILGTLTCFLIISNLITYKLNLNIYNEMIIKGLFEVTSGLKLLSNLNISDLYKTVISTFLLSFGGLCVQMQVYSQINDTDISFKPYIFSRVLHAIVSSFVSYFLYLSYFSLF